MGYLDIKVVSKMVEGDRIPAVSVEGELMVVRLIEGSHNFEVLNPDGSWEGLDAQYISSVFVLGDWNTLVEEESNTQKVCGRVSAGKSNLFPEDMYKNLTEQQQRELYDKIESDIQQIIDNNQDEH